MTGASELEQLLTISRARYDHQRQAFIKILADEARLRNELARLTKMGQTAKNDAQEFAEMRAIGADLLWRGWLGRSKTELNMQLARVLAMKENEQKKVQRAFGKVIALEELIKEERDTARKRAEQALLHIAIETSLR